MQAAGLTNGNQYSATLPVLCYIDANNMLQHVTQGVQNASQIEVNLKNYCSAAPVRKSNRITAISIFKVDYVVFATSINISS